MDFFAVCRFLWVLCFDLFLILVYCLLWRLVRPVGVMRFSWVWYNTGIYTFLVIFVCFSCSFVVLGDLCVLGLRVFLVICAILWISLQFAGFCGFLYVLVCFC